MKVSVEPDEIRVVYSVSFGPLAALLVRREMDSDRSRTISAEEARAGAADLQDRVSSALRLEIGGHAASARWAEPFFEGVEGALRTDPFTIEMTARVAVLAGEESLFVLEDRFTDRHIERSTYAAVATPPAAIVACGPRRNPRSRESAVMLRETGEPVIHVYAVRLRTPAPPGPKVPVWLMAGGVAAVVLLVGGMLVVRRWRRTR